MQKGFDIYGCTHTTDGLELFDRFFVLYLYFTN